MLLKTIQATNNIVMPLQPLVWGSAAMTQGPDHYRTAVHPWFSFIKKTVVDLWQSIMKLKPDKIGNIKKPSTPHPQELKSATVTQALKRKTQYGWYEDLKEKEKSVRTIKITRPWINHITFEIGKSSLLHFN